MDKILADTSGLPCGICQQFLPFQGLTAENGSGNVGEPVQRGRCGLLDSHWTVCANNIGNKCHSGLIGLGDDPIFS